MKLQNAHKAFVEAVIRKEAEKLIHGKASPASKKQVKNTASASAAETAKIDKQQRPNAKASWLKATAKDANSRMEREARLVTKAIVKDMKAKGQISALGIAPLAVAGAAVAYHTAPEPIRQTLHRREMIGGLAAALGIGLVAVPGPAEAGNSGLVDGMSSAAKSHAAAVAPAIVSDVAKG